MSLHASSAGDTEKSICRIIRLPPPEAWKRIGWSGREYILSPPPVKPGRFWVETMDRGAVPALSTCAASGATGTLPSGTTATSSIDVPHLPSDQGVNQRTLSADNTSVFARVSPTVCTLPLTRRSPQTAHIENRPANARPPCTCCYNCDSDLSFCKEFELPDCAHGCTRGLSAELPGGFTSGSPSSAVSPRHHQNNITKTRTHSTAR
ncbi:hypothetical protein Bbelb_368960 [Branchiostoma belcheri]|nr:hypothetical protein Bbelb_368960 [Branchiostoma belcheri]